MKLALAILIALQVGDIATTVYDMETGLGHEGNPFAVTLLSIAGYPAIVAAKTVAVAYLLALFLWMPRKGRALLAFVIQALAVIYAYLVYSNAIVGGLI